MKLFFFPFIASIAIFFDSGSQPVPNRVTGIQNSVDTLKYQNMPGVLLITQGNVTLPPLPFSHWKVSNGLVRLMTSAEIAAVSNAAAAANLTAKQEAALNLLTNKEFEVYSRALYHTIRKFWGTNVAQNVFLLDLKTNVQNFVPEQINE